MIFWFYHFSIFFSCHFSVMGVLGDTVIKNLPASAGDIRDVGSIPGLGRSPAVGKGNPLQYSCLDNPMDREPGRLRSRESQRVGHDWINEHTHSSSKKRHCCLFLPFFFFFFFTVWCGLVFIQYIVIYSHHYPFLYSNFDQGESFPAGSGVLTCPS